MSGFVVRINFGSVRMGVATGRWVRDPDGWWREIYTDTIWLDQYGQEQRHEPCEAVVRLNEPHDLWGPIPYLRPRQGWFWRLLGMERGWPTEVSR